jgi:hypothetical protein
MLNDQLVLEEVSANDLIVSVDETIAGLHTASSKLTVLAKVETDAEQKNYCIDSLHAFVSAITYMSIMHETVEAIRCDLNKRKGGASC